MSKLSRSIRGRFVLAIALGGALSLTAGCDNAPAGNASTSNATSSSTPEINAEAQSVILSIPGMDCPMCPITVRRALGKVDGVSSAEADLATKEARVLFDPAQTDVESLIKAVENAGFSASRKE